MGDKNSVGTSLSKPLEGVTTLFSMACRQDPWWVSASLGLLPTLMNLLIITIGTNCVTK